MNQIVSIADYIEWNYRRRVELWEEVVGNPELRLFGRVHKIFDNICVIQSPRRFRNDHKLDVVQNPLEYGYALDEILGLRNVSAELRDKGIHVGDYVSFSLHVEAGDIEPGNNPIIIQKGSIAKMTEVEGLFTTLSVPRQAYLFTDFTVNDDGVLQYVSEPIQKLLDELANDIEELIKEKDKLDNETKNLEQQLDAEKAKQENKLNQFKQEKLTEIQGEIAELEAEKAKLEDYRLFSPATRGSEGEPPQVETAFKIDDPQEALQHIQHYLVADPDNPLYYEIDTLAHFYAGLRTDQLVVLAGSPGTGKTSLVEGFAKAVSAELRIIPVQPNWIDKSDLLGFYNPIEKSYVSTPFLDAILEAKKKENENKLFIICLDEMNLAHVEYYFAEFLSKLQTDRVIELYSQNIKKDIETELEERYGYFEQTISSLTIDEFLQQKDKADLDNYFQMKKQIQLIHQYEPLLEIPNNIRFVGTINKDETTKDLSPKVIDRSFFMRIGRVNVENMEKLQAELEQQQFTRVPLNWNKADLAVTKGEKDERLQKYIRLLTEELQPYSIALTNRFNRTVGQLSGIGFLNRDAIKDILFTSLVLPKVSLDSYETDLNQLLNVLDSKVNNQMNWSANMLEAMKMYDSQSNKITALTYWR